jgi:hypothetical protein
MVEKCKNIDSCLGQAQKSGISTKFEFNIIDIMLQIYGI